MLSHNFLQLFTFGKSFYEIMIENSISMNLLTIKFDRLKKKNYTYFKTDLLQSSEILILNHSKIQEVIN